ncbi:hypothetical protein ACIA8H_04215 [Streptomyces goshikiensis]
MCPDVPEEPYGQVRGGRENGRREQRRRRPGDRAALAALLKRMPLRAETR